MKKEIRVYLEDILDSVAKIEEYTSGVAFDEFKSNTECQDAVIRRLEIIGEAVKNLPNDLKEKYPGTQWKQIAGMRDILIHEYAGVSLERVWKVIISDLQPLKNAVSRILSDL
ncbi:MAG: DUF86 domain-containing protein [Candidatus Sungbacteria bacterium]|uniref:DUF86 domain-containing protein n=1 Tax=Candidatus Sungiibacteriota bacterium TaxID=2750080 RepID=A0A931SAZ9_9BACT|nr:DUF86 domain-containing protein [Candidatus Sungbacteria bacterium]